MALYLSVPTNYVYGQYLASKPTAPLSQGCYDGTLPKAQFILSQSYTLCQRRTDRNGQEQGSCGPQLPIEPFNKLRSSTFHCHLGPRITPVASKCSMTYLLPA